jgi:hypothetical protein
MTGGRRRRALIAALVTLVGLLLAAGLTSVDGAHPGDGGRRPDLVVSAARVTVTHVREPARPLKTFALGPTALLVTALAAVGTATRQRRCLRALDATAPAPARAPPLRLASIV